MTDSSHGQISQTRKLYGARVFHSSRPAAFRAGVVCLFVFSVVFCGCADQVTPAKTQTVSTNTEKTKTVTGLSRFVIQFKKTSDEKPSQIEVSGFGAEQFKELSDAKFSREQWSQLLRISVHGNASDDTPSMLGSYKLENERLIFEPRFPFVPGLKYSARFGPAHLPGRETSSAEIVSTAFALPEPPATPPAFVEHVYPSRDVLPENQLKFYIHFSAPMRRGEAYDHVHLMESSGKEVDYPFLKLGEELWDYSGTRFTLFIDPGRIKRGLKPREDNGPSLEMGKSYTLVIDADWPDARDRKLKQHYRKDFKVIEPDEAQPDPKKWKIAAPAPGSSEPLVITFSESLDHAMLRRVLLVLDPEGKEIDGKITIENNETHWEFQPDSPWSTGKHSLQIETTLEDLAGNSIGRPFEVDVIRPIESNVITKFVSIPFDITGGDASH